MPQLREKEALTGDRGKHIGNRRRSGYELTKQRDMVPIALGAGLGALLLHLFAWHYCPALLTWGQSGEVQLDKVKQDEEVVRIVVNEKQVEEIVKPEPEKVEETPPEIVSLDETMEIDILDMEKVPELAIAPGETNLFLPQPEAVDAAPEVSDVINPEPINLASLPTQAPPPALIAPSEPVPVNTNDVIANVSAQPDDAAAEASAMVEESLRTEASANNTPLPGDTRSLAELMGMDNPGARSGVARLGADVLFGYDQCQLRNSARITMLQLAALILKNPTSLFIIEGHTDSFGGEDYNALLSLQRAAAVREWLTKNGVPVDHVYIRPCGYNNPLINPKASMKAQALNRRVEIHVRRADEKLPVGCVPHTVAVDTVTPVVTQIANGVRVPEAYASAYGKKKPEAPAGR